MDECCIVCSESLEWTGYGPCGHTDTCSKCVARLRFLLKDKRCSHCQQETDVVFFTRYMGNYTHKLTAQHFHALQYNPDFAPLDAISGFFDDRGHFEQIKDLCGYTHPEVQAHNGNVKFRELKELKQYVRTNLGKQFCEICLYGRKVFLCEQLLYTPTEIRRHMTTGDIDGPLAEGGFKGHPMCEYCRSRFYSEQELFHHNRERHETCFICRRENQEVYHYYQDYDALQGMPSHKDITSVRVCLLTEHFRAKHHLCSHPQCLSQRFVVFTNAAELRRHVDIEHEGNSLGQASRSQRREALAIETNFQFSRPAPHNHRGRERFPVNARQEYDHEGRSSNPVATESLEERDPSPVNLQLTDADFPEFVSASSSTAAQPRWPVHGQRQRTSLNRESFPSLPGQSAKTAVVVNRQSCGTTMAKRVASKNVKVKKAAPPRPLPNPNLRTLSKRQSPINEAQTLTEEEPNEGQTPPWVTLSKQRMQDSFPVLGVGSGTKATGQSWGPRLQQQPQRLKPEPLPKKGTDTSAFPSLDGLSLQSSPQIRRSAKPNIKVSDGIRAANKALMKKLKNQMDSNTFGQFHQESENFMKEGLSAEAFHRRLVNHGLAQYVAEIATMCPDSIKRSKLLEVHSSFVNDCKQNPDKAPIFVPVDVLEATYTRAIEQPIWSCSKCSTLNISDADFCENCDSAKDQKISMTLGSRTTTNSTSNQPYRKESRPRTLFGIESSASHPKSPWGNHKKHS